MFLAIAGNRTGEKKRGEKQPQTPSLGKKRKKKGEKNLSRTKTRVKRGTGAYKGKEGGNTLYFLAFDERGEKEEAFFTPSFLAGKKETEIRKKGGLSRGNDCNSEKGKEGDHITPSINGTTKGENRLRKGDRTKHKIPMKENKINSSLKREGSGRNCEKGNKNKKKREGSAFLPKKWKKKRRRGNPNHGKKGPTKQAGLWGKKKGGTGPIILFHQQERGLGGGSHSFPGKKRLEKRKTGSFISRTGKGKGEGRPSY